MENPDREEKKEAIKAQIRELVRSKTEPLEQENSRLAEENQRFAEENSRLAEENQRFAEENNRLTEENQRFTEENSRLTEENQRFAEENSRLTEENQRFTEENSRLTEENQRFTEENSRLAEENQRFSEENDRLAGEISRIERELTGMRTELDSLNSLPADEDEISRRAGRIIIDAQQAAQRLMYEAEKRAAMTSAQAHAEAIALLDHLKDAESAMSVLKYKGSEAIRSIDTSLGEVSELARVLGEKYNR